jgi:uncharacterized protein HemX
MAACSISVLSRKKSRRSSRLLTTTNEKGQVEGVKYDRVGVILVNAVNEQQAEIEAQRKKIETQDRSIEDLRRQVDQLKKLMCAGNPTAEICKEER